MSGAVARPGFNYTALPPDLASVAIEIADRIRNRLTLGYLATGHDLIEMKEKLGHGRFGAWLSAEFGMSARTAERYMAGARFEIANSDTVSHLLPVTMHRLGAPSMPQAVRDNCIALAAAGHALQEADVVRAAREHRSREKEAARLLQGAPKTKAGRAKAKSEWEAKCAREAERDRQADKAKRELGDLILRVAGAECPRIVRLLKSLSGYDIGSILLEHLAGHEAQP